MREGVREMPALPAPGSCPPPTLSHQQGAVPTLIKNRGHSSPGKDARPQGPRCFRCRQVLLSPLQCERLLAEGDLSSAGAEALLFL